jgi:hypothetical protein
LFLEVDRTSKSLSSIRKRWSKSRERKSGSKNARRNLKARASDREI